MQQGEENLDDFDSGLGKIATIHDQIGDLFTQRKERIANTASDLQKQEWFRSVFGLMDLLHMVQLVKDDIEIVAVFEEAVSVVTVEIVPILARIVVELLYLITSLHHVLRAQYADRLPSLFASCSFSFCSRSGSYTSSYTTSKSFPPSFVSSYDSCMIQRVILKHKGEHQQTPQCTIEDTKNGKSILEKHGRDGAIRVARQKTVLLTETVQRIDSRNQRTRLLQQPSLLQFRQGHTRHGDSLR